MIKKVKNNGPWTSVEDHNRQQTVRMFYEKWPIKKRLALTK